MPSINVSLKQGANASELEAAKKQVEEQGGKVTHEFKLVKGFTYVYTRLETGGSLGDAPGSTTDDFCNRAEFPADKVHTLQSNEHIEVENDGQVKTQ